MMDKQTDGVAVCDLNCETCGRKLCTGAAVLARECAADARLHLGHRDLYGEGLARIAERCERAAVAAEHDGFTSPALPAGAWRDITVYSDGSGNAAEIYRQGVEKIFRYRDVLALQLAWITKHAVTLAGLNWRVGYLDPEIKVSWHSYRGRNMRGPGQVAALWPGAAWMRRKQKYSKADYDWTAEIDGVTVIIEYAESEDPKPKLEDGPVDLSAFRAGDPA